MLLDNFLWKKFHDFIAEAARAFVPYFEVLQDGFVERPCDADLVFSSWILDVIWNILGRLAWKMFKDKQPIIKRNKDGET